MLIVGVRLWICRDWKGRVAVNQGDGRLPGTGLGDAGAGGLQFLTCSSGL